MSQKEAEILSASFFFGISWTLLPDTQTFQLVLKAPDCLLSLPISFPLSLLHLDAFIFGSVQML